MGTFGVASTKPFGTSSNGAKIINRVQLSVRRYYVLDLGNMIYGDFEGMLQLYLRTVSVLETVAMCIICTLLML